MDVPVWLHVLTGWFFSKRWVGFLVILFVFCSDRTVENPVGSNNADKITFDKSFIEPSSAEPVIQELCMDLREEYRDSVSPEALEIIDNHTDDNGYLQKRSATLIDSGSTAGDTLIALGIEAVLRGSMTTALVCFLEASVMHRETPWYLSKTGFALKHKGRFAEAREILLYSRDLDPEYHETHANLAGVYKALGDNERAAYEWQAALEQYPGNYMYHIELAGTYKEQGLMTRAYKEYVRAKQLAPHLDTIDTMLTSMGDTSDFKDQDAENIPVPEIEDLMEQQDSGSSMNMIFDTVSVILQELREIYTPELLEIVGIEHNIEQQFINEEKASAALLSDCTAGDAACWAAHCSRCQAALAKAKGELYPNADDLLEKYNEYIREVWKNAMSVYYRNPDAVDRSTAYSFINSDITELQSARNNVIPNTEDLVALLEQSVGSTCEEAAQAVEDAKQDSIEAAKTGSADGFEVCIIIVCFGNSGDKISISGAYGFASIGLSYDMEKNVIGVSAGVTLFNAVGVGFNVDSNGDANITTSARMPLPIGVKYSEKTDNISMF